MAFWADKFIMVLGLGLGFRVWGFRVWVFGI